MFQWITRMNRIDKAVRVLSGYCAKQYDCEKCRFSIGDVGCKLKENVPVDWCRKEEEQCAT